MSFLIFGLVWLVLAIAGIAAIVVFIKKQLALKIVLIILISLILVVGEVVVFSAWGISQIARVSKDAIQSASTEKAKSKSVSLKDNLAKETYELGETVKGNKIEFTLKSVEKKINKTAYSSTEYCFLNFELTNRDIKTLTLSTSDFSLRDTGGDKADDSSYNFSDLAIVLRNNIQIEPDQTATKTLAYECSTDLSPYTLSVEVNRYPNLNIFDTNHSDNEFIPIKVKFEYK